MGAAKAHNYIRVAYVHLLVHLSMMSIIEPSLPYPGLPWAGCDQSLRQQVKVTRSIYWKGCDMNSEERDCVLVQKRYQLME